MDYDAKNAIALQKLRTDFKAKVEILQLSNDTRKELRKLTVEVLKEESDKTPQAKKVAASIAKFQAVNHDWSALGEGSYQAQLAAPSA
jgi:TRAP-type mannitol/chloroaromatic compound transport system substrate-binding protein